MDSDQYPNFKNRLPNHTSLGLRADVDIDRQCFRYIQGS